MRPVFHPDLVNDPFGDPALYVDFLFERRALLFDLGDLGPLPTRKILRLTHAFVSHAHMDHFVGFDRVLRTCLHRPAPLHLFGPPGFVDQVEHKLLAYTWNLAANYPTDFTVVATALLAAGGAESARFRCRAAFRREPVAAPDVSGGVLVDDPAFRVRAAVLDHQIPCLAFALEETVHVNVWSTRLAELHLPPGPWLRELKAAVLTGAPDDRPLRVPGPGGDGDREMPVGELRERLLSVTPGQKIGYVVDAAPHEDNARRIVELVHGADVLFVETPFLEADADEAARKYHLTARCARLLARRAGVKRLVPFHFSPRYSEEPWRLVREAEEVVTDE